MTAGKKETLMLVLAGIIPVTWLGLKFAPFYDQGMITAFEKYEKICTLVSVEKVEKQSQTGFRSEVRFLKLHVSRIIQLQNTMA